MSASPGDAAPFDVRRAFYDAMPDLDGYTPDEAFEAGVDKVLAALKPVGWRWYEPRPTAGWHFDTEHPAPSSTLSDPQPVWAISTEHIGGSG